MSASERLEIVEQDEAGNVISTYIASGEARVDVVLPEESKTYAQQLLDVFLPAGYPHSVTDDYIHQPRQDSLQAFSSSIAGLLASRAVLEGVGVGDSSASPTAALLLTMIQESLGRVATILFAHRLGTSLEPECKAYRLAADVFNDAAMVLDCLSPALPKPARVALLSLSSCLRALCGVCAGSAKASLSAHFAVRGNLGELNAKDASQETVVSLLGMLAGSVLVSFVTTTRQTWGVLVVLLAVHLGMNYWAVRAVAMTSLNRQRACIVFSYLLRSGESRVLGPKAVSQQERVFERDGVLRCVGTRNGVKGSDREMPACKTDIVGYCRIGVSMQTLLSRINTSQRSPSGTFDKLPVKITDLLDIFASEGYILWLPEHSSSSSSPQAREALIVLKKGCTPLDQLKAWMHAWILVQMQKTGLPDMSTQHPGKKTTDPRLDTLKESLATTRQAFRLHAPALREAGWNLDMAALETRAGVRAVIAREEESSAQ
ncbi:RUS1 family protein-like protein 1 [Stagonosporopsis vannaccii]|nr:RUS1 family protein-like protein 1 [Stagonosporopsis vannaccii]